MENMHQNNVDGKYAIVSNNRALYLTALFVVAITSFLLHFNLLYAPMQGDEFRLLQFDDLMHGPATAITALDRLPGSPLGAFVIGLLWRESDGAIFLLRGVALLAFVLTVALLFQAIRLWLNCSESVTTPLLCTLLFAVSPATVGVLAAADAYPAVFGLLGALVSIVLFLKATHAAGKIDYLCLVLACVALATAVAAHHSLLLLPVGFVALDFMRKTPEGALRLLPAWTAHAALSGTALAAAATIHYSGGAFVPFFPPFLLYFASCDLAFTLAWILAMLPGLLPRRALALLLIVVLPVGGVLSFRQALRYVDPILYLEQQIAVSDAPALYAQLSLQYLEAARREPQSETQLALLQEALAAFRQNVPDSQDAVPVRRILGERLLAAGNDAEAALLLEPFLAEAPFDSVGHKAAVALAHAISEYEEPSRVADYYAFARRVGDSTPEDTARYGKTLLLLGNTTGAAMLFSILPDLDENSEMGIYKKQTLVAHNTSRALMNTAREKMIEDPMDAAAYIASAESELLAGNTLRAFYWIELALHRDPAHTQAWELMGVIFARHQQENAFVEQWGNLKGHGDQAWLSLARQAAMFQAWDASFTYVKRYISDETPPAEEFMAAFAIESRHFALAEEWFMRATTAQPDSYIPWLGLADIAAAMQNHEEARQFLDEARQRNAPAEEIEKRKIRLESAAPSELELRPFEPARSYIQ